MDQVLKAKLVALTKSKKVMLFMKGDKYMPKCGFSGRAVEMLNRLQADFTTFDILEDAEVRQGLKEFSDWPTFPQLYIDGELIGGADIMAEMLESGELAELVKKASIK